MMKKYMIKLNGKVFEVEIEEITGEAAVTAADTQKAQPVKSPSSTSGGETVEAPMPGNILAVAVKAGDIVKKGQVLVVLEAMKMENEIVSTVDGKVSAVSVSKGQTVNAGDVLVQIV